MFNSHEPSKSLFVAKYKGESNADNTSEMIFKVMNLNFLKKSSTKLTVSIHISTRNKDPIFLSVLVILNILFQIIFYSE